MKVAVLVVAFNSQAHLARQLETLQAQTLGDFRVVLLDNASAPSERPRPVDPPPWLTVVQSEVNLGFAAGNNRAADEVPEADLLVLLNPDAFPEPTWLAELVAAAGRWPAAAVFGSTQLLDADPSRLDGAGDVLHAAGVGWRGGFGFPVAALPPEGESFAACGAAMAVRASDFRAVGGFDERFFCYLEDLDLAFRLRLRGRVTVQVPSAVVRHIGGGTSARGSAFSDWHGARNRLWAHVKCMPGPLFWPLLPVHLSLTLANVLGNAARGRRFAGLRGLAAGVAGLGPVWQARRELRATRTVPVRAIARSLAWDPRLLRTRAPVIRRIGGS